MRESVYLLRANPALTTNVKLVCDSTYNLYLESYSANKELSSNKYKKFLISSNSFLSERIAYFYKDLPSNIAFDVKNDIKSDTVQLDINNQYDDIYYTGPRAVEDTRYTEEFQYNTTLKIEPDSLPKWFFIFRVDGTGLEKDMSGNFIPVDKLDTKSFKIIKTFDLSKGSQLGVFLAKNYIEDDKIPVSPFELNLKKFEFSTWNGYDYKSGGTVSKSMFLDDYMRNSTTHYDMEKFITAQFQKNEVICSNYLNLSFLFDDTVSGVLEPSTNYDLTGDYNFLNDDIINGDFKQNSDVFFDNTGILTVQENKSYRKRWTINRYLGFYLNDIIPLKTVSPVIPSNFNTVNVSVYKNEFIVSGTQSNPVPVMPLTEPWDDNKVYSIKIGQIYYHVRRSLDNSNTYRYYIISDTMINPDSEGSLYDLILNYDKIVKIVWQNSAPYIVYQDLLPFQLDFDDYYRSKDSVFLMIKIQDSFYNVEYVHNEYDSNGVVLTQGYCKIITDNYITCDDYKFVKRYGSNKEDVIFTQLLNDDDKFTYFEFYLAQLNTIADFDQILDDTAYANIEYDYAHKVNLNRPLLVEQNIQDLSKPKDTLIEKNYQINTYDSSDNSYVPIAYPEYLGEDFILPLSSEYGVSGDLYMLDKNLNISDIWNINKGSVKFGFFGSVGNCSYPYKLNNDINTSGKYNFNPNPFTTLSNAAEFSLDWFYTIGPPRDIDNSSAPEENITFRTLNIDSYVMASQLLNAYSIIRPFTANYRLFEKFDIESYKTSNFDIFNYFFNIPTQITLKNEYSYYDYYTKIKNINTKRHAILSESDGVNGPSFLFKGMKAYIEYVKLIDPNSVLNDSDIAYTKFNPADDLKGYKFSILFDNKETDDITLYGKSGIDVIVNKRHSNILVFIYIYTPYGYTTTLHFRRRDLLYSEDYVYYLDDLGNTFRSNLLINSLNLNNIYDILNNCKKESEHFDYGISYTLIEDKINFNITSYSVDIVNEILTVKVDKYCNFKTGDWIYLNINDALNTVDKKNYRIEQRLNGSDFKIKVPGLSSFTLIDGYMTSEISNIPFRIKCVNPDKIDSDPDINIVVSNTTAPFMPDNNINNINNVINHDISVSDGIIENVWNNNPMLRELDKNRKEIDLSYAQIDNLPKIYRYSGNYEPILNCIPLFNTEGLKEYGRRLSINPGPPTAAADYFVNVFTFYVRFVNNKYKLFVDFYINDKTIFGNDNPFSIGDVIKIKLYNDTTYNKINNRTTTIVDITNEYTYSYLSQDYYLYEIETDIEFDSYDSNYDELDILGDKIVRDINTLDIVMCLFKRIEHNTEFNTKLKNFGINKNIILGKWSRDIAPVLKSSNPVYDTKNKYAMSDEHGVMLSNRNIFKSSFDIEYYYSILKNKYNN